MKRVILLQIMLLAGIAAAATDPNLVGWWKLDDGNGTAVLDSAGTRNGTIYGATWTTDSSLSFDGINDYVELPNNDPIWLPQDDLTLSTWVYFDKDPSCSTVEFVLGFNFTYWGDPSLCLGYCIHRNWCDGKAVFQFETAATTDKLYSNDVLLKSKWYHIAAVRQGTTQKIYLDGQLNGTRVCSPAPVKFTGSCNDHKVNIGKASDGCGTPGNYFLDGMVNDVQIYNRALSDEEIQQLYEETSPALTGLEIVGPDEVAEESTASYKAIAHYDNGTTKDVTTLAEWLAEPNIAAVIDAGQLTTGQALYPKHKINIYAQYTEEQTTVDAQKQVSVIAICPQGNALMFDGVNDYVDVPDNAALRFTKSDSFSICSWAKPISGFGEILGKMQSGSQYGLFTYEVQWNSTSQSFDFLLCNSGNYYKYFVTPTDSAPPGSWYHFACVYQNKDVKIYLNGELAGSGYFNSNPSGVADRNLAIGVRAYGSSKENYFNGTLDDVHIYNRALSADEIQTIMHIKPIGSDPNLVAYWDFDEGMGQMVADISGHGNNGALGNNAGIDTADPCWVESDAPVGRCTTEQVLGRNLLGAIDNKKIANQLITDAKAREQASVQLITELQKQMNVKEKINAIKAKAQIGVAIVQEETVSRQIDATIKRLEEALWLLDYVIDSNSEPPVPSQPR